MRLLLFSDLHLDAPFAWARPEARRRRDALRETLRRIVKLANDQGVDAVLCGGDLYEHDRINPDTKIFIRDTLARASCPVYIAPGNHDWFGPQSLYAQLEWSENVRIFLTNRLEPVTLMDGLTLWGAAHCGPANTPGFLDNFRVDRAGVHIALFHGAEQGSFQTGGKHALHAPFRSDQVIKCGLNFAFLGHFHQPSDSATHIYPGNPEPLGFGEDGERGAVLATVAADGTVTCERHCVAASKLHDLTVDLTDCASRQDVRDRVTATLTNLSGLARVTLTGEMAPTVDCRRADFGDLTSTLDAPPLVRWGAVRVAYDLDAIKRQPTVQGEFVRQVLSANLPEPKSRRVLLTGLRALDGHDDLEVFDTCDSSQ